MICPKCGGSGKIFCSMCKGTGLYHEDDLITEQEYIQTCNTEQLAEFLHGIVIRAVQATWDGKKPDYPAYLYDWEMWLKQPHRKVKND